MHRENRDSQRGREQQKKTYFSISLPWGIDVLGNSKKEVAVKKG
jgi:hypothetical protein